MAISMQDFLNERASGNTVSPEDVRLSFNEMAKLSRLQAVDPRQSGYGGLAQAQEATAEIPGPQDLGLMVEQNKQLQAAGGLGYSGTMHGTYGEPTPFDKLTEQIQQSKEDFGSRTGHVAPTGTVGEGTGGDAGSGQTGGGGDIGQLGHFGMEAMTDWGVGLGKKGLLGATAVYGMGAPAGVAANAGLLSTISPLGMLAGISKAATGGIKDMEFEDTSKGYGIDGQQALQDFKDTPGADKMYADVAAGDDMTAFSQLTDDQRAMMQARAMEQEISNRGFVDTMHGLLDTLANREWTESTKLDKSGLTGLHQGLVSSPSYADARATSGLQSTFGDPMGTGFGRDFGFGGRDDRGGDSGGRDSGGGFGDREASDGGYGGGMGGI